MESAGAKGKWIFQFDASADSLAPFCAISRPDIRVSRGLVTPFAPTKIYYKGYAFCMVLDLLGLVNLTFYHDNQDERLNYEAGPTGKPTVGIADRGLTWFQKMNEQQFEQFIADIEDPDLYECLFNSIPDKWDNPSTKSRPVEKLRESVGKINFIAPSVSGNELTSPDVCFDFVRSKIRAGQVIPKQARSS